ncbi:CAP domain-containing protein [Flagellimonas nanhaiensis]|uniref:CAP domain-containing protein n=1 Tax=Flagellimonas nanhaiensis TaxID=2292706 RepID=A0A371JQA3_9FLAO|nr:CAP domain-containing protein [Allomuricauda nanhaiensis]RDY59656.1 CAP domain-containing protein [Allomuricauda nanhaiensis]
MKKLFGAILIATSVVLMSMCSTSSTSEQENEFTETLLGNDKIVVDAASMEEELLDLVNAHRASIGKTALGNSSVSYKYAEEHNNYMISKNKLSHDNFDSRASKIAAETNAIEVSENVARYYTTAQQTLNGWLNSTAHKEALEGNYTHTTLSVELDKDGRPYYTQIFITVE